MMHTTSEPFAPFFKDPVELNMISLKSKLIIILTELIREKGWSQKVTAEKLGVRNALQNRFCYGCVLQAARHRKPYRG